MNNQSITTEFYATLDEAFCIFNAEMFDGKLNNAFITLQRKGKNNLGFHHAERFANRLQIANLMQSKNKKKKVETVSEIALNPDRFPGRSDKEILSTLLHEMCHEWEHQNPNPKKKKVSRGGYHSKYWGAKMKEVGLYPSNTGKEGGKETGQQMTHYIIKGGKFETVVDKFLTSHKLNWTSFRLPGKQSKKNKVTYECPMCGAKVWGKPDMTLYDDCGEVFEEI